MDPLQPDDSDKGTLVLTLNLTALSQLTLVPLLCMQIVSFDIQGTGPDPLTDTFSDLGNTTGLLELGGLTPGYWTITVDARNVDGTIIGHGQTDPPVLITAGQVTDAQITIAPLSATGGLQLVVEWPKDTHTGATVQCSLVSMATGVDLAPAFSLTPDKKPFKATHKNPAMGALPCAANEGCLGVGALPSPRLVGAAPSPRSSALICDALVGPVPRRDTVPLR